MINNIKKNKLILITTLICLLPMILSVILYDKLPTQIAVHFDAAGNPNGYANKAMAGFGMPAIMAVVNVFCHIKMNNDPKKRNSAAILQYMGKWIAPALSVVLIPMTLFMAMGYNIPTSIVVPAVFGVILTGTGNYLPKCKQNYTVGIKLPWTLNSENNWNKTHHMAGYLWMAGGVSTIILSCLQIKTNFSILMISIVVMIIAIPIVYSFVLYKKGI